MLSEYLPIVILVALAGVFAVASLGASALLRPRRPTPAKLGPYECGIVPEHEPPDRFPVRFYVIAMLFIIFDIETIFFFPFAVLVRELGLFGLAEMGIFVGTLLAAYIYIRRSGGFEWEEEETTLRRVISRRLVQQYRTQADIDRMGA